MARVWAHCNSSRNRNLATFTEFSDENVNGWTHCKNFGTLPELLGWMAEERLSGRVSRLAINSHGSAAGGGAVELDHRLNLQALPRYEDDLRRLTAFFDLDAEKRRPKLMFSGCATAAGPAGTSFMQAISTVFAGVTVVAFEVLTTQLIGNALGLAANEVWITNYLVHGDRERVSPYHPAAKWVRDGIVLRYPASEQERRPGQRCAYPFCPGHDDRLDQCDGGWHKGCEWHGAALTPLEPEWMLHGPALRQTVRDEETDWHIPRPAVVPEPGGRFRAAEPLGTAAPPPGRRRRARRR